eukprot:12744915-Alexandrium_andersonii.AAC.1
MVPSAAQNWPEQKPPRQIWVSKMLRDAWHCGAPAQPLEAPTFTDSELHRSPVGPSAVLRPQPPRVGLRTNGQTSAR